MPIDQSESSTYVASPSPIDAGSSSSGQGGQRRFAMSVDVEDYLHTWALSPVIGRDAWDR